MPSQEAGSPESRPGLEMAHTVSAARVTLPSTRTDPSECFRPRREKSQQGHGFHPSLEHGVGATHPAEQPTEDPHGAPHPAQAAGATSPAAPLCCPGSSDPGSQLTHVQIRCGPCWPIETLFPSWTQEQGSLTPSP